MAQMGDDDLKALVAGELRQAYGYYGGRLANSRQKAEYYYLGLAKGDLSPPEIDGRSSVVSTDVRNTIESMLPQLMLKFAGGDTVVEFEPTQSGDEEKAKLATDYCNYLFFKKNNGHNLTYTFAKDGLLQKRGFLKIWWDTRDEEKKEEYTGLDDVELSQLMDDEEITVTEHTSYVDEDDEEQRQDAIKQLTAQLQQAQMVQGNPQAMQAAQAIQGQLQQIEQTPKKMLHDVTCKRVKTGGKITIENVPPEEILISRNAKTIDTATFIAHRVARTKSELKSMGYKNVDSITSDDSSMQTWNAERIERLSYDDEMAYLNTEGSSLDESQRMVWVTEAYIRCDYDGDGIAELRKVTTAGNEILDNEVVDVAPFVSWCPIPLPHKFFGLSVADVAMESQRVKTSILRSYLDNLYLQVNGRYFAVEGQCNLDDLLTSRPGGVVRIKTPGATGRLDQGMADSAGALNTLQYMEDFLENSTGWTRYSQGNDSSSLNKTATGMNIITNRSDMRMDLICRQMAEGFTDLFKMILKLVTQYQNKEQIAKIAGEWVPIDPREWRNQFDVTINVGLGVGNKDQQAAHLMNLMAVQEKALQIGVSSPENIYNAAIELAKMNGFKNSDKFFSDPAKAPPQQPHQDPAMLKVQSDHANTQAQMQLQQQKDQAQSALEQARDQMQAQLEQMRLEHEMTLQAAKAQADQQLEAMRLERDAEVQLQIAKINAESKILAAQIAAEAKAVPETDEADSSQQAILTALQGFTEAIGGLAQIHAAPKELVVDPTTGRKTVRIAQNQGA